MGGKTINDLSTITSLGGTEKFPVSVDGSTLNSITFENIKNQISPHDYIVESYSDEDGNWYRKYKSGWIEQGGMLQGNGSYGLVSVSFFLPFKSTDYFFSALIDWSNTSWYSSNDVANLQSVTDVSGIGTQYSSTGCKVQGFSSKRWFACGQGV